MLDTTKPIILTSGFHDSRGNYYPPKKEPYFPGEISIEAWKSKHAEQLEEETENKAVVVEEVITNPSEPIVVKQYSEALAPEGKTIKPRTIKQSNKE